MKRIILLVAVAISLIGYTVLGTQIASQGQELKVKDVKLHNTTTDLQDLQTDHQQTIEQLELERKKNEADSTKAKELEQKSLEQEQQIKELQDKLQAKLDAKKRADELAANAVNRITGTATASAATPGNIDCNNQTTAKAFIYCHESGNNPAATNAGGCRGLGQACPGSKLPCGDHDYACQDEYFTGYMLNRYGSWEAAKAFWQARVPINGRDVGNWW